MLIKKITLFILSIMILVFTQINCETKKQIESSSSKKQQKSLTIVSFGGAYSKAQNKVMIKPYIKKTGIDILFEDYNGGIKELKKQIKSNNVIWDVLDLEFIYLDTACNEGLLEELPHDKILQSSYDATPARDDFMPEALSNKCAVGTIVWSIVMAYKEGDFPPEKTPKTLKDFFNIKKFPGKRVLIKRPQVNLEWALLADDVPKNKIYEVLATPEGIDRAFKKLNTIKKEIIWSESWSQPTELLASGDAKFIQSANGRVFSSITKNNQPFKIIWDNHSYDLSSFVVPKGTKNKKLAFDFISFATQSKPLAGMPAETAYGPVRYSSRKLYDQKYNPHLPTFHINKGFKASSSFWSYKQSTLTERFNTWLSNK